MKFYSNKYLSIIFIAFKLLLFLICIYTIIYYNFSVWILAIIIYLLTNELIDYYTKLITGNLIVTGQSIEMFLPIVFRTVLKWEDVVEIGIAKHNRKNNTSNWIYFSKYKFSQGDNLYLRSVPQSSRLIKIKFSQQLLVEVKRHYKDEIIDILPKYGK